VAPENTESPPPSPSSPRRRSIFVQENFELFHLVLFYLYTEQITFVDSPSSISQISECNVVHEAEPVYAIAHRLMIDSLKEKAAHFLKATTNLGNISQRTFSRFALEHEALGAWYDEYFLEKWEDIKVREEFQGLFKDLADDMEEFVRVSTKFRQMIVKLPLR